VTHLLESYGLVILFLLVAVESAGVPLPGETILVTAAVLSTPDHHHFSLVWVIVVAACGAIVGDNAGYWIGRAAGRRLIERWDFLHRYADRVLPPAERFFERHGSKAVFLARFVSFLRVTAAWIAGISRMPWWRFLVWNAAGGIVWAGLVAVLAYEFGKAATEAIARYGLYAGIAIVILLVGGVVGHRLWRHRRTA
jgi:membrane protein DedA with SNARE-associated domain